MRFKKSSASANIHFKKRLTSEPSKETPQNLTSFIAFCTSISLSKISLFNKEIYKENRMQSCWDHYIVYVKIYLLFFFLNVSFYVKSSKSKKIAFYWLWIVNGMHKHSHVIEQLIDYLVQNQQELM